MVGLAGKSSSGRSRASGEVLLTADLQSYNQRHAGGSGLAAAAAREDAGGDAGEALRGRGGAAPKTTWPEDEDEELFGPDPQRRASATPQRAAALASGGASFVGGAGTGGVG